jgi:hypothetical protein
MKFKDKVFQMRNDQPYLNPIGINMPEFAKLYKADKSASKSKYAAELAYVYHMWEYDSPYYDLRDKESKIIRDYIKRPNWKPTKQVQDALAAYEALDDCAEKRALDAAISVCDQISESITEMDTNAGQFTEIIQEIEREIKEADSIDLKIALLKQKLDLKEQHMKILTAITKTMPQLEKTIETSISLRKKVTQAVYKGENASEVIGQFLMDDLMDELDHEQLYGEDGSE